MNRRLNIALPECANRIVPLDAVHVDTFSVAAALGRGIGRFHPHAGRGGVHRVPFLSRIALCN